MTVRSATFDDRHRAVALLRDFHAAAGLADGSGQTGFHVPCEAAYLERLFVHHLRDSHCCAIVYEPDGVQGLLLAAAAEHPFGPVWFARDTAWWIDPAHRGGPAASRMLDCYEAWAKEQGCAFVGVVGMGEGPAIDGLLRRRGYRAAERHYLKRA